LDTAAKHRVLSLCDSAKDDWTTDFVRDYGDAISGPVASRELAVIVMNAKANTGLLESHNAVIKRQTKYASCGT